MLGELEKVEQISKMFEDFLKEGPVVVEVQGSFLVQPNSKLVDFVRELVKLGIVVGVRQHEPHDPQTSKRLRQRVVEYLMKVNKRVTAKEIAKILRVSVTTARKVMRDLESMGLVEVIQDGRKKYFKLKHVEGGCVLMV